MIKDSSAGAFAFVVQGNEIGGSVELVGNEGPMSVEDNAIGGHLRVVETKSSSRPADRTIVLHSETGISTQKVRYGIDVLGNSGLALSISENAAGGELTCKQNDAAPTGADNTAKRKRGQCRTFLGDEIYGAREAGRRGLD